MEYKKLLALDWAHNKETAVYCTNVGGDVVTIQWDEYPHVLGSTRKPQSLPCLYLNGEFMKVGRGVSDLVNAIREKRAARFDGWYDNLK